MVPYRVGTPLLNALTKVIARPMSTKGTADWNPSKYLKFAKDRTRPASDLLAQVPLSSPGRIVDLGCGPGNSTAILAERYLDSLLSGMDSSPNMVKQARTRLPKVSFEVGDLNTYSPNDKVDLFFSNAVFQWLPSEDRIPVIKRLLGHLSSGGCFAFQMPLVGVEPCHYSITKTAQDERWKDAVRGRKPASEPLPTSHEVYNAFAPLCSEVDIWYTYYEHHMESHQSIVDWFKETGMRPYLNQLSEAQQTQFMERYYSYIQDAYPPLDDGSVLLKFPRQFVVLTKS